MSGQEAIALLELTSIARGYRVIDALVKKAPVCLIDAGVISPGKYLIAFAGDVASVEESYLAGLEASGHHLLDHLFLPQPHMQTLAGVQGVLNTPPLGALGVVECFSAIGAIRAADVALKACEVALVELHWARHLGGKGYFTLSGEQFDVESALEAASGVLRERGLLLTTELIARPHEDLLSRFSSSS